MIIDDIKQAQNTTPFQTQIVVGGTFVELVGQNRNRVALIISTPNTGTLSLSMNPQQSASTGIYLAQGQYPFQVGANNETSLAFGPYWGAMIGGTQTITILESVVNSP